MKIGAFCVCDANYINPAIIAIDSFCRFNAGIPVVIYTENGGNYRRLKRALIDKNVEFRETDFPQFPEHDELNAPYKNLFFQPESLPAYTQRIKGLAELRDEFDVIINFDLDTLTTGNISNAPFMQFVGRITIHGVSERENRTRWQKGLNITEFANMPGYINTGIGIYGADAIPADITRLYREFLHNYADHIYCPEQDFINFQFADKIKNIPPGYNLMSTGRNYKDISPVMIHFVGTAKPWTPIHRPGIECYFFRRYYREACLYRGQIDDEFLNALEKNVSMC